MTETILISGANRGIGLELVRQYAEAGWQVHACCRSPAEAAELHALARTGTGIHIHGLDVSSQTQITALAESLHGQAIDVLFNNAGVYGQDDASFGNTDVDLWLDCFHINSIAPLKMCEAFVRHLAASRHGLIATMSSKMGSMSDNHSGGSYVYRSSKAAVNAAMKSAAIDLRPMGIRVAILHPGWVRTDMGGPQAEISAVESVQHLRRVLAGVTLENSGSFFDYDGSIIPW